MSKQLRTILVINMGILDFFRRNQDDSESYGEFTSTRIICQTNEEGKMMCKKYVKTSDNTTFEENVEDVPYDPNPMHDDFSNHFEEMLQNFMGPFGFRFHSEESPFRRPEFHSPFEQRTPFEEFNRGRFPAKEYPSKPDIFDV